MIDKYIYNCYHTLLPENPINIGFQAIGHPFLLENQEYYKLRRMLHKEQHEIVKDITIKKRRELYTPFYLFLTDGAGT